jgi:hypothetical protein
MSAKFTGSQLILLLLLFFSCSKGDKFERNWRVSIPGNYEGVSMDYREVLEFRIDGTFNHRGYSGNDQLFDEKGRWVASTNAVEIELTPDAKFTELYNPRTLRFSPSREKFANYILACMAFGGRQFFFHICIVGL